jgi:hypothetical protein
LKNTDRYLVAVSFFEPRPQLALSTLLTALRNTPAGAAFDIALVVNRTGSDELVLPDEVQQADFILSRSNEGMNIGAWNFAWQTFPDYDAYLFLQDDCVLQAPNWLESFVQVAADASVGLVGESWNAGWDRSWATMRKAVSTHSLPGHAIDGKPVNRVDLYLDFMERHQVSPGRQAGHLRALTWFATRTTLQSINGFLRGSNYGECIAAEIAATKQVEAVGLKAVQVESRPFAYFGHLDWHLTQDGRWQHR